MIPIEAVVLAAAVIITVSIIALPCIRVVTMVLKIPSAKSQQKAFCTYAGHLTVFLIFFGSVSLVYLRFNATHFGHSHCTDIYSSSPHLQSYHL